MSASSGNKDDSQAQAGEQVREENLVEDAAMDMDGLRELGMSQLHEELWSLRAPDVARAYHEVVEKFWPQVNQEINSMDVQRENFNDQAIPLSFSHSLLKSELSYQKQGKIPIDPSACVALSKTLELFVMELTLHAYHSPTALSTPTKLTKEELKNAIRRNEVYDFLVDHT
eukprot:gene34331-41556_t